MWGLKWTKGFAVSQHHQVGTFGDYGPVGTSLFVGRIGVLFNFMSFTLVVDKFEPRWR